MRVTARPVVTAAARGSSPKAPRSERATAYSSEVWSFPRLPMKVVSVAELSMLDHGPPSRRAILDASSPGFLLSETQYCEISYIGAGRGYSLFLPSPRL